MIEQNNTKNNRKTPNISTQLISTPLQLTLEEVFDKSKSTWGFVGQVERLAEESAEVAVAALHLTRDERSGRPEDRTTAIEKLLEEHADAQYLMDEIEYFLKQEGVAVDAIKNSFRVRKRKRLEHYFATGEWLPIEAFTA